MPSAPNPQEPLWVEACTSRLTNFQIDHKDKTDAAKQRRSESSSCRDGLESFPDHRSARDGPQQCEPTKAEVVPHPVRCRNIRHCQCVGWPGRRRAVRPRDKPGSFVP